VVDEDEHDDFIWDTFYLCSGWVLLLKNLDGPNTWTISLSFSANNFCKLVVIWLKSIGLNP